MKVEEVGTKVPLLEVISINSIQSFSLFQKGRRTPQKKKKETTQKALPKRFHFRIMKFSSLEFRLSRALSADSERDPFLFQSRLGFVLQDEPRLF